MDVRPSIARAIDDEDVPSTLATDFEMKEDVKYGTVTSG